MSSLKNPKFDKFSVIAVFPVFMVLLHTSLKDITVVYSLVVKHLTTDVTNHQIRRLSNYKSDGLGCATCSRYGRLRHQHSGEYALAFPSRVG